MAGAYTGPRASRKKLYKADIIFCVDVTGKMDSCMEHMKNHIRAFVDQLRNDGSIDYRLALMGYRNRHDTDIDPSSGWKIPTCEEPWFYSPGFVGNVGPNKGKPYPDFIEFTESPDEFKGWLGHPAMKAYGGGQGTRLSALDALYDAVNRSHWRDSGAHRTIVLLTDADTHPTVSKQTYKGKYDDIRIVMRDIQTKLKHGILFMCAPRLPIYEELATSTENAARQSHLYPVQLDNGLKEVNIEKLLLMIAQEVSRSAPSCQIMSGEAN